MQKYITRAIESTLRKALSSFPAVVVTGPRQAGKTTMLREKFGENHRYVSLDVPDVNALAQDDPRGFLDYYRPPVILDEIQHAPSLLPYIKELIDKDRNSPGQFILTGSQNLLLLERVSETLAGRAAILRLLPLSQQEMRGDAHNRQFWEQEPEARPAKGIDTEELWSGFLRGGYPELHRDPQRDAEMWHASYIQTYVERDVRSIRQVGDLGLYQSFVRLLAARSAQVLNIRDISSELGVSFNTAKAWISVLEASYQIAIVRPFHANIGKRLVKSPKVYFLDVGTLCYLTGLRDARHAAAGPMAGAIMETAVFGEIYKSICNRGVDPRIHFWRTATGIEVDFIVPGTRGPIPIEVKTTATPRPALATPILQFRGDIAEAPDVGYVVYSGNNRLPLKGGVLAIPFSEI